MVLLLKLMLLVRESRRVVPLSLIITYMSRRGPTHVLRSFTSQNIIY